MVRLVHFGWLVGSLFTFVQDTTRWHLQGFNGLFGSPCGQARSLINGTHKGVFAAYPQSEHRLIDIYLGSRKMIARSRNTRFAAAGSRIRLVETPAWPVDTSDSCTRTLTHAGGTVAVLLVVETVRRKK